MSDLKISVSDGITPELNRIAGQMKNTRPLMAALGKQLEIDLRKHFRERDAEPNARGWPKRHFWRKEVSMNTALTEVSDTRAVVSIASPALMHKVYGGTITAKRGKSLSIPISPEAYKAGSASLFPRPLTMVNRPGKPPLLIETGVIGKSKAWKLHYVLLRSVTHAPDPKALPEQETLTGSLLARARAVFDRIMNAK